MESCDAGGHAASDHVNGNSGVFAVGSLQPAWYTILLDADCKIAIRQPKLKEQVF